MKTYTTVELENRLYEFISENKEHLNYYGYVLDFVNYLNQTEDD